MDFRNVPADWVRVWMVRDWVDSLVAVYCLAVSVNSCIVSERVLVMVNCFEASTSNPRDCWTVLMKVPAD